MKFKYEFIKISNNRDMEAPRMILISDALSICEKLYTVKTKWLTDVDKDDSHIISVESDIESIPNFMHLLMLEIGGSKL